MTDQVVFRHAGFVVQHLHMSTEQVDLSEQLNVLRHTEKHFRSLHLDTVQHSPVKPPAWQSHTYLLDLLLKLQFLGRVQVEG